MKRTYIRKENIVLVSYWHSKNRYTKELLLTLLQLRAKFKLSDLRIVALNPFETEQIIQNYSQNCSDIEWEKDAMGTYIFYQIQHYPSFMLMTESGQVLLRKDGIKDDCFKSIKSCIRDFKKSHLLKVEKI